MTHTSSTYRLIGLVLCFLSILFASCKKGESIGFESQEKLHIEFNDQTKIVTSTYLLDSLPTSNTGSVLLGIMNDKDLGKLTLSSYCQLSPPVLNATPLPKAPSFDSFDLVLKYNKYSYGDTTALHQISVHRLTEKMVLRKPKGGTEAEERPVFVNGPAMYSTSTLQYAPDALGSSSFKPKPHSKDSVVVSLNKVLGEEFFNMIINKDKRISNETEFLEYFKGIAITSSLGGSITGFIADSVKMNLNYTYTNSEGRLKKGRFVFRLQSKEMQFNHIDADRSQTKLSQLSYSKKELSSLLTDKQLFIQGGMGIVAKLQFAELNSFLQQPKIAINKVEMIIETNPSYYSIFKAPESLILFVANSSNTPKSIVPISYGKGNQLAPFQRGDETGSNGRYSFLLTEYVNGLQKGLYKNTSLLLSLPVNELLNSVGRAIIATNKSTPSIKLYITYTRI